MNDSKIISSEEKNIATVTHLGGLVFFFIPAIFIWMAKQDESEYITEQAKEALNFQITFTIALFFSWVLSWILIGYLFMLIFWIINAVFCLIAAIATSRGKHYRYPITLRLIN